mmetsp:Transcript_9806/g.21849  ORF Transcript_9806/g.21849 Transcript_9806/m.21849 type:complete len:80 (-) Transcript_9806:1016-1255(-)
MQKSTSVFFDQDNPQSCISNSQKVSSDKHKELAVEYFSQDESTAAVDILLNPEPAEFLTRRTRKGGCYQDRKKRGHSRN